MIGADSARGALAISRISHRGQRIDREGCAINNVARDNFQMAVVDIQIFRYEIIRLERESKPPGACMGRHTLVANQRISQPDGRCLV